MTYLIPIRAAHTDKSDLLNILKDIEKDTSGISIRDVPSSGLAMDAGTIALIVDIAKVTIPALITVLGSIWVAHIEKKKDAKDSSPVQPRPIMIIETTITNIKIDLNDAHPKILPQSMDDIVRIRFE